MSDYIINYTDESKSTFVIKPYTANGPLTPASSLLYSDSASGLQAVSANTSLALIGKGITDYGDVVQNNMIYLMEHFANATRPRYPIQGQIWYKTVGGVDAQNPSDPTTAGLYLYTGVLWSPITISGLDIATGDIRYLQLSGGTVTGPTSFTGSTVSFDSGTAVTINRTPSSTTDATNKQYVDTADSTLSTSIANVQTTLQSQVDTLAVNLNNLTISVQTAAPTYLQLAGGTMIGSLNLSANASLIAAGGGTGVVSFGTRRVEQVGDPLNNSDAANKLYVDTAINTIVAGGGTGTSDGVVTAGNFNSITGVLTLQRSLGLGDVVVSGNFAAKVHTHTTQDVTYSITPYNQTFVTPIALSDGLGYTPAVTNIIRYLDQGLYNSQRPVHRKIIKQTTTGTTTFNIGTYMSYPVGENRLQVFVDGIKKYASERGYSRIPFTRSVIGPTSLVGVGAGATLYFKLFIDGGATAHTVTITTTANYTFLNLVNDLQLALDAVPLGVTVSLEQFETHLDITFTSNTVGTGSEINVSTEPGFIFDIIPDAGTPDQLAITANLDYVETGNVGDTSTQIVFTTAPADNAMIELLVFP